MDVIFLGSGAFGVPTLERLARDHNVTGIVTQPDRKAGRGSKITPTPIGQWASENLPDVPIIKPEKINDPVVRDTVRSWNADAWVIIAYGQYLGSRLIADRFAINLHASRLPRWRGASPINSAIVAGDQSTGNSVITIDKEMDAGAVLAQSYCEIPSDFTAAMLHDQLSNDGPDLIAKVLEDHFNNQVEYLTQDPSQVTIASKMSKSDGVVDFSHPARLVSSRINGLNPWPSITVGFRDEKIKINQSKPIDILSQEPAGTIVDADNGYVVCGDKNVIQLLMVQPAGKRSMDWKSFANGRSVQAGEKLLGNSLPTVQYE
ncbi:MAG: methionyl-tRNA formyltransferase [Phycisphaerales bacterium]|nr:methionyl-tRNA formyltransferase [Phycisphaerales bacterium]